MRAGAGCPPAQAVSYYELFASGTFDLENRTLSTNLVIPSDASLIGGTVGVQAAVIAPDAHPAGVVTSGLVTLRIGEL